MRFDVNENFQPPAIWETLKASIPANETMFSDPQNEAAAKAFITQIQQRHPDEKSINLLSLCSGDGRSEAYFVAYLKEQGITVKNLITVDSQYTNNPPPFLDVLKTNGLIEDGYSFGSANDYQIWRQANPSFLPHAVAAVHFQISPPTMPDSTPQSVINHIEGKRDNARGWISLYKFLEDNAVPFVKFLGDVKDHIDAEIVSCEQERTKLIEENRESFKYLRDIKSELENFSDAQKTTPATSANVTANPVSSTQPIPVKMGIPLGHAAARNHHGVEEIPVNPSTDLVENPPLHPTTVSPSPIRALSPIVNSTPNQYRFVAPLVSLIRWGIRFLNSREKQNNKLDIGDPPAKAELSESQKIAYKLSYNADSPKPIRDTNPNRHEVRGVLCGYDNHYLYVIEAGSHMPQEQGAAADSPPITAIDRSRNGLTPHQVYERLQSKEEARFLVKAVVKKKNPEETQRHFPVIRF